MKTKLIGLLAMALIFTASAVTVSAQLDNLPKLPHKKPEPGALPDLTIQSATFHDDSVNVVFKNIGNAPAKPVGIVLQLHETIDPKSKIILTLNGNTPMLAPGKDFQTNFGTPIAGVWFKDHARRIVIDPANSLVESNRRNNELLSTGNTEAAVGAFPESGAIADLTILNAKFVSPSKVEYCIKNIGTAASSEFKVRTVVYHGEKKDSGVDYSDEAPFNSLKVGATECHHFMFATYGVQEIFINRSRSIEILPTGPDGKTGMKNYFEAAKQSPWSSSH